MHSHMFHRDSDLGRLAALLTALLASLAAVLSYGIIDTQNRAILLKNDAIIALITAGRPNDFAQHPLPRPDARAERRALDSKAARLSNKSDRLMTSHKSYKQALVLDEIAVALASVATLAERRWLLFGAVSVGAAALILGLIGLI